MSDQRFKELLNLYLDHRLSEAEAVEFEQLLRADPARQKTLRDYETVQCGCSALFARAAARAPSSAALCRSLRQVEQRISKASEPRGFQWGVGLGWAGAGLAACAVVLVTVRMQGPATPDGAQIASATVAVVEPGVETNQASTNVVLPVTAAAVAVVAAEPLSERQKARNLTLVALGLSADETASANDRFQWADARDLYVLTELSPDARNWMSGTPAAVTSWSAAQPTAFSVTNETAGWSQGAVSPAGYRFER